MNLDELKQTGPQQRKANLSPLMQALGKASLGEKVNFCPHGCENEDLDENGLCVHLVGYTIPGNDRMMEPLQPPDHKGRRVVCGARPQPVLKGDKLVKITICSRVYRETPDVEKKKSA